MAPNCTGVTKTNLSTNQFKTILATVLNVKEVISIDMLYISVCIFGTFVSIVLY